MPDFAGDAERAVDDAPVVDDAQPHAFADEVIGEVVGSVAAGEQIVGERTGAGVLFDEHGHAKSVGELFDEVDSAPALHGGDDGGVTRVAQIRAGDGHADGDDGAVFAEQRLDALVDTGYGFVDGVFVDVRQGVQLDCLASEIEYADLH